MIYKYDYSKLNGKIVEVFGTKKKFAQSMDLSEKSISAKTTNKRGWQQPEISKACELLQIPSDEINSYFFKYKVQDIEQNKKEQTWNQNVIRIADKRKKNQTLL